MCRFSLSFLAFLFLSFATPVGAHDNTSYRGTEPTGPVKEIVKLSTRAQDSLGIKVTNVKMKSLPLEIATLGEIEAIPTRTFVQHALLSGRVSKVTVELGDRVVAGQVLAVLDSPEVNRLAAETLNTKASIEAEIEKVKSQYDSDQEKAEAKLSVITANRERMHTLYKEKIVSKKAKDGAEADFLVATSHLKNLNKKEEVELRALKTRLKVSLQSLTDRLRQVGIDDQAIKKMISSNSTILKVPVRASRSGVVTSITANPGETINDQDPLFDVLDLSTVWATADVYEHDMSRVRVGQRVEIKATALPGLTFKGRLSFVGSEVDRKKRTLPVKVEIKNKKLQLKPEMYVDMLIQTQEPTKAFILPREAVVEKSGHFGVFLQVKPGVYQLNIVEIGRSLGDNVEVLAGLKENSIVVTRGAFQLDAHLLKSQGNTDLFSHPTEEHEHDHGEEGEHHHGEGEENSKNNWSPLNLVFLTVAFLFGGIVAAVLIKSTSKNTESTSEIDAAFEESIKENRHD